MIGEINQAAVEGVAQNLIERRMLICARGKILIAVSDRDLVPFSDAVRVGVGNIGKAVSAELD